MVSKIRQARILMIHLVGVIVVAGNDVKNDFVQFTIWRSYFPDEDCLELCAKDDNCTIAGRVSVNPTNCFVSDSIRLQDKISIDLYFKKGSFLTEGSCGTDDCQLPFGRIGNLPKCYYTALDERDFATWDEAEEKCQSLDPRAHLVSIDTKEESEAMSSLSAVREDKEGMNTMWTGGRDQNSNDQTPTWIGTNEKVPEDPDYWYYDEIDHKWGDCVFMYIEEEDLSMSGCDVRLPYVCEIQ